MLIFPPLEPEEKTSGAQTPEPGCYEHFFYADQLPIEEADYKPIEFGKYTYEDIKRIAQERASTNDAE